MDMNESTTRLTLSDRLVVDLQFKWGGWDMVVTIYGKYNRNDSVERLNLEWKDGVTVHNYLTSEGWIGDEPLKILESFDDFSKIDPNYHPKVVETQDEPYKDSYGDEPPTDFNFD